MRFAIVAIVVIVVVASNTSIAATAASNASAAASTNNAILMVLALAMVRGGDGGPFTPSRRSCTTRKRKPFPTKVTCLETTFLRGIGKTLIVHVVIVTIAANAAA